ncbi:MAG: OmpA family protein [Cyclobacteriaceae bacterium]|nr:OmpA family protein [Cyclobacteriaceae bacterium]
MTQKKGVSNYLNVHFNGQSLCHGFANPPKKSHFHAVMFYTTGIKRVLKIYLALLFMLLAGISFNVSAQKQKKGYKNAGIVALNDSLTSYSQSDMFDFPNINKSRYYYDETRLKNIQKLDSEKKDAEMYTALKSYVRNFGIENFNNNIAMVWRLAQLSEKYGQPGEALLLYKLVIKHHRQGLNIQDIYAKYQQLDPDKKENYVPLEFYYELVAYRKDIDTLRPPKSILLNMGELINSNKEDYGPTIGNIDDIILFTSKRNEHLNGTYNEDLFFSVKDDGRWTYAQAFVNINSEFNEGSACLNMDGKELIFSRCNAPDGLGNCDLYVAKLKRDSTWGEVKNLGPLVNSTGWDSHPSLTKSGDTLFFASNRTGTFGLSDIFYTVKDKKGNWQKAMNAGPIINTAKSEVSPFLHHAFNVLYFSSNGHPLNFGEFDIYKSNQLKSSWAEPKNIGPLVNGGGSEYYFTIDSKSENLYYARSIEEDIKNLDLHSFPVPMEAQPLANTNLRGSLKDPSGIPEKGIVSIIDLDEGVEVAPKFLSEEGKFDFSLINKRNYLLIIQGDNFFRIEEMFFLNGELEINKISEPLESKIAFQSLEFENGKSNILPEMHADLNKLGSFLIDHPTYKITISGHTDSAGKEESNLRLSQARADAIKSYLTSNFPIEDTRIVAIGYGSSKPIVKEETDEHRQLNRRVEFEIRRD